MLARNRGLLFIWLDLQKPFTGSSQAIHTGRLGALLLAHTFWKQGIFFRSPPGHQWLNSYASAEFPAC